jgi:hypothetical protein
MSGLDIVIRKAAPMDLLAVLRVHAHRDPEGTTPEYATPLQAATWDLMMTREGLTLYLAYKTEWLWARPHCFSCPISPMTVSRQRSSKQSSLTLHIGEEESPLPS